jgi:hypothetical protein
MDWRRGREACCGAWAYRSVTPASALACFLCLTLGYARQHTVAHERQRRAKGTYTIWPVPSGGLFYSTAVGRTPVDVVHELDVCRVARLFVEFGMIYLCL